MEAKISCNDYYDGAGSAIIIVSPLDLALAVCSNRIHAKRTGFVSRTAHVAQGNNAAGICGLTSGLDEQVNLPPAGADHRGANRR